MNDMKNDKNCLEIEVMTLASKLQKGLIGKIDAL
jgi:hypothetical protein